MNLANALRPGGNAANCAVCGSPAAYFAEAGGCPYYKCRGCGSIFIEPAILSAIDGGKQLLEYDEPYWRRELPAAKQRAYGPALARMAEVLHYCRTEVRNFIDIGTGPGYFLDAVSKYLPNSRHIFHACEKFPPPQEFRTDHPNYFIGDVAEMGKKFDAGLCMEVVEHLTPAMLDQLLAGLATASNRGAAYIFNSGFSAYVEQEDRAYLDPLVRGHIASYSITALTTVARRHGFSVTPIEGKNWACLLEYMAGDTTPPRNRIWTAKKANLSILEDKDMGSALRLLGLESARAMD